MTAVPPRPAAPDICRCGLPRGTAVHGNPFGAGHPYDPRPSEAQRAYDEGRWCGECEYGVVADPPCCTQPAAPDATAGDGLREAMLARWLRDRVQVPEHRAITASYAFFAPRGPLRGMVAAAEKLNQMLREAGIEYPLGLPGVSDLIDQRDGQRQRAEEAEAAAARDAEKVARVRELADFLDRCAEDTDRPNCIVAANVTPDRLALLGRVYRDDAARIRRALDVP